MKREYKVVIKYANRDPEAQIYLEALRGNRGTFLVSPEFYNRLLKEVGSAKYI